MNLDNCIDKKVKVSLYIKGVRINKKGIQLEVGTNSSSFGIIVDIEDCEMEDGQLLRAY